MKLFAQTLKISVIVFCLIIAHAVSGNAGDRAVSGLVIGSGSGAIVGQAIGRDPASTIIGATVGGVIGLVVGSEMEHQRGYRDNHVRVVTPPPPPRPRHDYNHGWSRDRDCRHGFQNGHKGCYKSHPRQREECYKVEKLGRHNHRETTIVCKKVDKPFPPVRDNYWHNRTFR